MSFLKKCFYFFHFVSHLGQVPGETAENCAKCIIRKTPVPTAAVRKGEWAKWLLFFFLLPADLLMTQEQMDRILPIFPPDHSSPQPHSSFSISSLNVSCVGLRGRRQGRKWVRSMPASTFHKGFIDRTHKQLYTLAFFFPWLHSQPRRKAGEMGVA